MILDLDLDMLNLSMKKFAKVLVIICLLAVMVPVFTACSNHLGIPNGNYIACDQQGNIIEGTKNQMVYTIKGRSVTTHQASMLYRFNPNGRIVKAGGGTYKNDFDHFAFSYYQQHALIKPTKTYSTVKIAYNKDTKVLTVDESNYYTKGLPSGLVPTIPPVI